MKYCDQYSYDNAHSLHSLVKECAVKCQICMI